MLTHLRTVKQTSFVSDGKIVSRVRARWQCGLEFEEEAVVDGKELKLRVSMLADF